jgi:hypothetical protein
MNGLTLDAVTVVGDGARLAGGPKVVSVVGVVVVPPVFAKLDGGPKVVRVVGVVAFVVPVVVPVVPVVLTGAIVLVVFVPVAVGPYGLTKVVVEAGVFKFGSE